MPVEYFFAEMDKKAAALPTRDRSGKTKGDIAHEPSPGADPLSKRETLQLVRAYFKIRNTAVRQHIAAMIKTLAKE